MFFYRVFALLRPLLAVCRAKDVSKQEGGVPPVQIIQMPVDHFNASNPDTYENRFWVDSTYYQPGGPVVLFNDGEFGVSSGTLRTYLGRTASNMAIVRRHRGLAIILEHRYYGRSIPVPINETTGYAVDADGYIYLGTEQALEDMVYLANNFQPEGLEDSWERLHPLTTPWIAIGASYAGMLAVFSRIRSPETFFASWASSAPVETVESMPTYYEQIYQDMTANCSADMAAASRYLDMVLANGTREDGSTAKFLSALATTGVGRLHEILNSSESDLDESISGASTYNEYYAAVNAADMVRATAFQSEGFDVAMLPYCDLMQQWDPAGFLNASSSVDKVDYLFGPRSNASRIAPSDEGIASKLGDQAAFGAVLYATALHTQFSSFYNSPRRGFFVADAASWNWQHCVENPNWQVANTSSPYNLLSARVNVENSQTAGCGANTSFRFPIPPSNLTANDQYGGWHMQPSNVMFIDGMKDPWHTLSVHSTNTEIGAPNREMTQEVPACNEPPAGGAVFGELFPNSYHGADLVGSAESFMAVELFSKALDVWLPCFNGSRQGTQNNTNSGEKSGAGLALPSSLAILTGVLSVVYVMKRCGAFAGQVMLLEERESGLSPRARLIRLH